MPTFAPGYVPPGFYVQQRDISTPEIASGVRIASIIGQGAKTLGRIDELTKGVKNGQDGPLTYLTAIELLGVIDADGVIYQKDRDFKISRVGSDAYVDWSPVAALTATVDLTTLVYGGGGSLDGKTLRLVVDGGTGVPADQYIDFDGSLTAPGGGMSVADFINAWDPSLAGVASINAQNQLVLSANSVSVDEGNANTIIGYVTGQYAQVLEPAVGKAYQVFYTSDKLPNEYKPILYSNMNDVVSAYGPKQAQVTEDTGTASGSGVKQLIDAAKAWVADAYVGSYVKITSGTGKGQVRIIISNNTNTLTLSQDWSTNMAPDSTSRYRITDINDDSISMGSQVSVDTGSTFVICSQYADDIFNDPNIKLAIDNLKQDVSGYRPYTLVLMRGLASTETSPVAYLKSHVEDMSNVRNNKWRMAIMGMASGNTSFLTFTTMAAGADSDRMVLVNLTDLQRDFGAGTVLLDGSYLAAAWSGVICANEDAGTPLLRRSVTKAFDMGNFSEPFLDNEKDAMAAAGVSVFELQGVDLVCRDALNTDPSTQLSRETKLTRAKDFVSDFLKTRLEKATVGQRFVTTSTGSANVINNTKATLNFLFSVLEDPRAQIVSRVENMSVVQDSLEKSQLDITADIYLTPDVKWVYALLGFGV